MEQNTVFISSIGQCVTQEGPELVTSDSRVYDSTKTVGRRKALRRKPWPTARAPVQSSFEETRRAIKKSGERMRTSREAIRRGANFGAPGKVQGSEVDEL